MKAERVAWGVAAMLVAGAAMRLALQIPLHRWASEGDCTPTGFGAWEILAGDPRIFVSTGYRQGALASYFAAAASLFVGPGRAALALEVLAVALLQIFVWWQALLELAGCKAGTTASARLLIFVVLPSPAVFYWSMYWPTGYPEQILAAMLVLWAGARWWRRGGRRDLLAFGFAWGFAFWMSMLTFTISIPMLLWLAWQRPRELLSPRRIADFGIGAVLGALPWLVFNLRYGWVSLQQNWAVRPVNGWEAFCGNLRRLFGEVVPTLFGAADQGSPMPPLSGAERFFGWIALALVVLVVAVLAGEVVRRRSRVTEAPEPVTDFQSLLGLAAGVAVVTAVLFVLSRAATGPGNIVRYVIPVFLIWPLVFAIAWEVAGPRTRAGLFCLGVVVLCGYAAAVPWPWTAERQALRIALEVEHQMIERMRAESVDVIFGSYWEAYPLIFESGGKLRGSTLEPENDFHRFAKGLPAGPCRWALAASVRGGARVARRAGFAGRSIPFADGRWLFLPEGGPGPAAEAPTCEETLSRLRTAFRR